MEVSVTDDEDMQKKLMPHNNNGNTPPDGTAKTYGCKKTRKIWGNQTKKRKAHVGGSVLVPTLSDPKKIIGPYKMQKIKITSFKYPFPANLSL